MVTEAVHPETSEKISQHAPCKQYSIFVSTGNTAKCRQVKLHLQRLETCNAKLPWSSAAVNRPVHCMHGPGKVPLVILS